MTASEALLNEPLSLRERARIRNGRTLEQVMRDREFTSKRPTVSQWSDAPDEKPERPAKPKAAKPSASKHVKAVPVLSAPGPAVVTIVAIIAPSYEAAKAINDGRWLQAETWQWFPSAAALEAHTARSQAHGVTLNVVEIRSAERQSA